MNKTELVDFVRQFVAYDDEMTTARRITDAVLRAMAKGLKVHGHLSLHDFGTLRVKDHEETAVDPQTGHKRQVQQRIITFKPCKRIRRALNA